MGSWLPNAEMKFIYSLRQNYARTWNEWEANPTEETQAAFEEAKAIRNRAIRQLNQDDGYKLRELSAMFRTSKTSVKEALEGN